MVDHHDAGTAQPLGLMHKQVTALVVHVIRDDKPLWERKAVRQVKGGVSGATS